jgi:hypothetical protein
MTVPAFTRLQKASLFLARILLGYLFFTQLFWKMPPTFGCPSDFSFTQGVAQGGGVKLQRTSGLCDWIGIESVWASQPRPFFVADMSPIGGPRLSIDLGFLARINGVFIDYVVRPNIHWVGWLIWGAEAFIALSLILGLLTRLGGLVAIGISTQLMIGLGGIANPYEWEWAYILMILLALLMFAFAPGTILGVDALLQPSLAASAGRGSRLARLILWFIN